MMASETLYTSISPQNSDYFVCADTYQRPALDPQILHSLISTTDQTTLVAEFRNKCGKLSDTQLQELILRTRTHIVPNLVKTKNIEELSSLLVCVDAPFRRFLLRKLREGISCVDIPHLALRVVNSCLRNMTDIFPDRNVQDISISTDLCLPVIYLISALELLYCCRRNEKDSIKNVITSTSKTLMDKISPLMLDKKVKRAQPKAYAALKCVASFIKCVSTRTLSTGFQGIFERWEDAFLSKQHAEFVCQIVDEPFHEQYMVLFALHLKLKNSIPLDDHFASFVQTLFNQPSQKKWKEVQYHGLSEMTFRVIGSCLRISKRNSETFTKVMKICWKGMHLGNGFLCLPEELTDCLFMDEKDIFHIMNQSLTIDEPFVSECTEKYVQKRVPDIVIHDKGRQPLPRMKDNSYWSICQGRINQCQAMIAIHVPSIEFSKGNKSEDIKNKMLQNDLKILAGLQKEKTHINVVRLLAYSSLQNSVQFYVKDGYKMTVLDKLIEVREQRDRLPVMWFNKRLQDIIKALLYIHGEKIIHRDVTLRSFRLTHCHNPENSIAVLYDFNLACQTDFSLTATGRVTDLRGDGLPVRWSAVESILQDLYDAKTDIWMFGHVIHELFTYGCEPFTDQYSVNTDDIISGVLVGNISPYWWPCIPHSYHDLAVTCWRQDRDQRPSADDILKTLHDLERDIRDASNVYPDLPKIGLHQTERGHEPERGISPFIKKLKDCSLERRENVMRAMNEIRGQTQRDPRLAEDVTCIKDVTSPRDAVTVATRENLIVEEQVTEYFCENFYNLMTRDFCEKMGMVERFLWCGKRPVGDSVSRFVKCLYPKSVNILKEAREAGSTRQMIDILLAVARLVQRMHAKRWLLVSLTGRHVYIQHQADGYTAFFVKLGSMVRVPEKSDPVEASVHVSESLDDLIFWLPREVFSFGHLTRMSDVYTMAMLFFQVFMAFSNHEDLETVPYSGTHKSCILGVINDGHKPKKPPKCPPWLYVEVMMPCWHNDRSQRPSIDTIVSIMEQRIKENAGMLSCSGRDGGYLNPGRVDVGGMKNAEDSQVSTEYANVTSFQRSENFYTECGEQNLEQSFVLNEKELAQFEPRDNHQSVSSSVILPRAVNPEPGNLRVCLSEPQVLGGKRLPLQTAGPAAGHQTTRENPMYDSFTEGPSQNTQTTEGNRSEPEQDSIIRSSDYTEIQTNC